MRRPGWHNRCVRQYLDLLENVLGEGARKDDRTGTGTLSVFGRQMRFDLDDGFPLVTTTLPFRVASNTATAISSGVSSGRSGWSSTR